VSDRHKRGLQLNWFALVMAYGDHLNNLSGDPIDDREGDLDSKKRRVSESYAGHRSGASEIRRIARSISLRNARAAVSLRSEYQA